MSITRALRSAADRFLRKEEAVGSNPTGSTRSSATHGRARLPARTVERSLWQNGEFRCGDWMDRNVCPYVQNPLEGYHPVQHCTLTEQQCDLMWGGNRYRNCPHYAARVSEELGI